MVVLPLRLGVEDRDQGRAPVQSVLTFRPGLEHRSAAVVDGLASNAHRLDAPADRIGRVQSGEVFVARALVRGRQALEVASRDDGQSGDLAAVLEQGPLEGIDLVLVDLAIEDDHRDIAPAIEDGLQFDRSIDGDDLKAGQRKLAKTWSVVGGRATTIAVGTRVSSSARLGDVAFSH
jgi:hypothetical protein